MRLALAGLLLLSAPLIGLYGYAHLAGIAAIAGLIAFGLAMTNDE